MHDYSQLSLEPKLKMRSVIVALDLQAKLGAGYIPPRVTYHTEFSFHLDFGTGVGSSQSHLLIKLVAVIEVVVMLAQIARNKAENPLLEAADTIVKYGMIDGDKHY